MSLLVGGNSSEESDDDGMHVANSSKKLNSLFSISNSDTVIGNTALVYKAPRREDSKKNVDPRSKKVVLAAAVHCFRLVEGQFTSQGKLGLAFLAQIESLWYQVLIYSADKKTICKWTLKGDSDFSVQSNYVHFVDDQGFSWSSLFDNEDHLIHFLALCLIAKSDNSKGAEKFSSIDLISGDEKIELNLKDYDSLKCDCSEYVLTLRSEEDVVVERNFNDFFAVKNDESRKIRLGCKDVPETWEQCLRNAKRSRKILFVQKTDDNNPTEKAFAVIVFHIKKIKMDRNSSEVAPKIECEPEILKNTDQKSPVRREASPVQQNARLIAKIGHQIAQFPPSTSTVDSSTTDVYQKIETQNHQSMPENLNQGQFSPCSIVCHCCHCAYYKNNIPLNEISTIRNDIRNLWAKFDQVISTLEQTLQKNHRQLNERIDLLADKFDKIDAEFSSKKEE